MAQGPQNSRDRPRLTKFNEVAGILSLIVGAIGLWWVISQSGSNGNGSSTSTETQRGNVPVAASPDHSNNGAINQTDANLTEPAPEAPASQMPQSGNQATVAPVPSPPIAQAPASVPPSQQALPPQTRSPQTRQYPPPRIVPVGERAAFIQGQWRFQDDSCSRAQEFRISGDVIEIREDNGNMINSYRIADVVNGNTVIVGSGSAYFIRSGRELRYVRGGRAQFYEACS